jgi:glycine cleavage system H protein
MTEIPDELKYTRTHEWVRDEGDGIVAVGITDHAQELLGDLVFVELPEVGTDLAQGAECAVVESVKAAADIYSPLDGEVVEVNEALADSPEAINEAPWENWIFKLKMADPAQLETLLDASAYAKVVEEEEH